MQQVTRVILAATCCLAIGTFAGADEPTVTDAGWWSGLSSKERELVMFAVLDGYQSGFGQGRLSGINETAKPVGKLFGPLVNFNPAQLNELRKRGAPLMQRLIADRSSSPDFGRVDISLYVARVTAFYGDHPEASHATLGDIAQCLGRRPKRSCGEVAALTVRQRRR